MSTTENAITYGICNVHYATFTYSNGTYTYATPKALPGAVSISLSPVGTNDPFYADNIVYKLASSNGGYSGDLELAAITDEFRTDILKETLSANGLLVENSDASTAEFALIFQFEGDVNAKRHVCYRCKVSRPNIDKKTKEDKVTPQTEKLSITVMARESDHVVKATCPASNTTVYASMLTAIVEPTTV